MVRARRDRHGSSQGARTPARRQSGARLTDVRLWAGVALVVLSAAIGAVVLSQDDDMVTVWRAARDLSVGAVPVDLEPVQIPRTVAAGRYAAPGGAVDGVLRWPIAAGELLPRGALSEPPHEATRWVTVPVDPLHAPAGVQAGDVVDVWSTPGSGGLVDTAAVPTLVLAGASVASVADGDLGIGGELGVVLDVPSGEVAAVVAAARAAVLDLVAVPVASQQVRP